MSLSLVRPVRPQLTPAALRRIARGFAADRELLTRCPVDDGERTWLRLPTGPDVAAWLIRWPAGTSTGWHDHIGADGRGVGGVFTVAAGELTESWWSGHSVVRRTLSRGALRSFGPDHVHQVAPARTLGGGSGGPGAEAAERGESSEPAFSVHVYSPVLVAMRSYRIYAGRQLVLTGVGPLDEW
ncbi:MAG: cysteine dioxygenase [Actinomycetota bacterium]|nr:cysteine dioxygenase [Actinomycetota bacterium]